MTVKFVRMCYLCMKIQLEKMKRLYIFLFCVAAAFSASAQTVREAIKEMPDEVLPLLTKNDRLDFIDYLASNAKAEVKNKLGTPSEMTALTDDYAHIRLTEVSEVSPVPSTVTFTDEVTL